MSQWSWPQNRDGGGCGALLLLGRNILKIIILGSHLDIGPVSYPLLWWWREGHGQAGFAAQNMADVGVHWALGWPAGIDNRGEGIGRASSQAAFQAYNGSQKSHLGWFFFPSVTSLRDKEIDRSCLGGYFQRL